MIFRWLAHKLGFHACPQCETLVDYALDGLEGPQQEQVREHLSSCPSCMEQVRDYWQVSEGLGLCAPECEEPKDFNAKVLARLKAEEAHPVPPFVRQPVETAARLGGWPRFWMTLGPVFAGMSIIMTLVAAAAIMGRKPQAPLAQDELSLFSREMLNDPRAAHISLVADAQRPGSSGEVVLCPGRAQAFLKASHLSKCPQGRNYALWMKGQDGRPQRLARFAVEQDGSSMHVLNLSQPWQGEPAEFMVTQDSGTQAGETWLRGSLRL